jgi:hypothetical protein
METLKPTHNSQMMTIDIKNPIYGSLRTTIEKSPCGFGHYETKEVCKKFLGFKRTKLESYYVQDGFEFVINFDNFDDHTYIIPINDEQDAYIEQADFLDTLGTTMYVQWSHKDGWKVFSTEFQYTKLNLTNKAFLKSLVDTIIIAIKDNYFEIEK